jgi:porphobilinogen synthase
MRIDVLKKSFLTRGAHYKDVILVYLTVKVVLALLCSHLQQLSKVFAWALMSEFRNRTVKNGPHPDRYLVLERTVRESLSTQMAPDLVHGIDTPSTWDYKREVPHVPVKINGVPMQFPEYRARRLRRTEALRSMVREVRLDPEDFILPYFVRHGKGVKKPISSMPGHSQLSPDVLVQELEEPVARGIPAVLLFGIPDKKDSIGSEAYAEKGIVQQAIRAIKKSYPDLVVITDVCLCEYTDHGHCGVVRDGYVDNDETLDLLAKMALSHAHAGADMIAPSDMMDGRVGAIREALDEGGYELTPILAYAAKYASAFYGPFRDAAESPPKFGDRKSYQMDPANSDEAIRETAMDVQEGADLIMVKPALPYLDVIWRVRNSFDLPLVAYNVSGEFAMIKAAAEKGWIDGDRCMMEALTAIKRAGADLIISYHALEAARILQGEVKTPRKR